MHARIVFLDQFGAIRTRGSGIRSQNESQTRDSMTLESTGVLRASPSHIRYQSAAEPRAHMQRDTAPKQNLHPHWQLAMKILGIHFFFIKTILKIFSARICSSKHEFRIKIRMSKCLTSKWIGLHSSGSVRGHTKYRYLRITFTTSLHPSSSVLRSNGII